MRSYTYTVPREKNPVRHACIFGPQTPFCFRRTHLLTAYTPRFYFVQTVGGALVAFNGGSVALVSSVFEANFGANDTDSSGIMVLGGWVGCIATGCFPACTACQESDDDAPPPPPSSPTMQPVRHSPARRSAASATALYAMTILAAMLGVVVAVAVGIRRLRRHATVASLAAYQPIPPEPSQATSVELEFVQIRLQSVMGSPAPIFVLNRDETILFWSPGMSIAAPMLLNPVGGRLADLPFVDPSAAATLHVVMRGLFDKDKDKDKDKNAAAPDENDDDSFGGTSFGNTNKTTVMLHLNTKHGPVLLEMVANFIGGESEPMIMLSGREVNPELASLIAGAGSVFGADEGRASEAGDSAFGSRPASSVSCYEEEDDEDEKGGDFGDGASAAGERARMREARFSGVSSAHSTSTVRRPARRPSLSEVMEQSI